MRKYQREGKAMGGKPPYGWKREGENLVRDEKEQKIISDIWDYHTQDKLSASEISSVLNDAGTPCRKTTWHHEKVKRILQRRKTELTRQGVGA
jgi:NAD dependent epimerase/dehydratase family enzyme